MTNPKAKQAEAALLLRQGPPPSPLQDKDFVSTGVTLINLAAYGRTHGGMAKGRIYRIAGRSSAGKTFLCKTILAEAANNPNFNGYDLVYDDVERGALMDDEYFFGRKLADRIRPPARTTRGEPVYSKDIGDFYRRLKEKLDAKRKFIWVEDSMDSLIPMAEGKMTDGKAKFNSQSLRRLVDPLEASGSILVLVSQAHVDMRSMFGGDLAAGGRALEFYSCLDVWLRKTKTLKVVYRGKKYPNGIRVMATVKKNRISGSQDYNVYFPFHKTYGIDDIGANVDYLVAAGHWPREQGGGITAVGLGLKGSRQAVIEKVEKDSLQRELQVITGKAWNAIEAAVAVKRVPRYQ